MDFSFSRATRCVINGLGGIFSGAQDSVAEKALDIVYDYIGFKPNVPDDPRGSLDINLLPANALVWDKNTLAVFHPEQAVTSSGFDFSNSKNSSTTRTNLFNGLYGHQTAEGVNPGVMSHIKSWSEIKQDPEAAKTVCEQYKHLVEKAVEHDGLADNKWSRAAYFLGVYMGLDGMPSIQQFHTPNEGVRKEDTVSDAEGLLYSSDTWLAENEAKQMLGLCVGASKAMEKDVEALNAHAQALEGAGEATIEMPDETYNPQPALADEIRLTPENGRFGLSSALETASDVLENEAGLPVRMDEENAIENTINVFGRRFIPTYDVTNAAFNGDRNGRY